MDTGNDSSPAGKTQNQSRFGPRPLTLVERFWGKVEQTETCWLWTGSRTRPGYGKIRLGGKREPWESVHRLAYRWAYGPIPEGMFVCHRCDVRHCVRPAHLFLSDTDGNMKDMVDKGRSMHGQDHHNAKLTDEMVKEIRWRRLNGEQSKHLAKEFDVSTATVNNIACGRSWKHITKSERVHQ